MYLFLYFSMDDIATWRGNVDKEHNAKHLDQLIREKHAKAMDVKQGSVGALLGVAGAAGVLNLMREAGSKDDEDREEEENGSYGKCTRDREFGVRRGVVEFL